MADWEHEPFEWFAYYWDEFVEWFIAAPLIAQILVIIGIIVGLVGLLTSSTKKAEVFSKDSLHQRKLTPSEIYVKCSNCGSLNREDASYCDKCGKSFKKL